MFAYCNGNPVIYRDAEGNAAETVLDVVSLAASIIEVAANPANVWAWVGLAGDIVDVAVPFVGGVGETVRAVSTVVNKSDDVVDLAKTAVKTINEKTVDVSSYTKQTSGVYELFFNSGHSYVGKGGFDRMITSANRLSGSYDDRIVAMMWKPVNNPRDAYKLEYLLQTRSGVRSVNKTAITYNQIWSPGRRYFAQDFARHMLR